MALEINEEVKHGKCNESFRNQTGRSDQLNQESTTSSIPKKCLKLVKNRKKPRIEGKSGFAPDPVFKTMSVTGHNH